jgi:DNA repair exonuclease SbcCD ATPase subunit
MIDRLIIENFQKHKYKSFKLGKITVFIGSTGRGKSSVLRAIKTLCLNRATASVIKRGAKSYRISARVDGRTLRRVRGKRKNAYILDGKSLNALGKGGIPAEVQELLNTCDPNFQGQLDPPYLFTKTPGQVSKELNQVVNLDAIDQVLKEAGKLVRKSGTEKEVSRARLKAAEKQLETLAWVPEFLKDVARLEKAGEALARKSHKIVSLASLISDCKSARRAIERAGKAIVDASGVVVAGRGAFAARTTARALKKLIQEAKTAKKLAKQEVPNLSELLLCRAEADRIAEHRRELESLVEEAKEALNRSNRLGKEVQGAEEKLSKEKRKIKTCPKCGQPMKRRSSSFPAATFT